MFPNRVELYRQLEAKRSSKLIVYVTGDRPGLETQLNRDVYDLFVDHLDALTEEKVDRITLFLHTLGGATLAAWSLVNLLRRFCNELEVIVPARALSAGTIMCLGAKRIVMTKQAMLGPIDPSLNHPLGPQIIGAPLGNRASVSVEEINGYVDLAAEELKVGEANMGTVLLKLSDHVHPLVLGQVYRSRTQIQMLARKLLGNQVSEPAKVKEIISFLCSDSGSHDYTMNREEAAKLGLNIDRPDGPCYALIKAIYNDISKELKLREPYYPVNLVAANQGKALGYEWVRGLVESLSGGSHAYISKGTLQIMQSGPPNQGQQLNDQRTHEAWSLHAPPAP